MKLTKQKLISYGITAIIFIPLFHMILNEHHAPNGFDQTFYSSSLKAFHNLNASFESKSMPDASTVKWLYNENLQSQSGQITLDSQEQGALQALSKAEADMGVVYNQNFESSNAYASQYQTNFASEYSQIQNELGGMLNVKPNY